MRSDSPSKKPYFQKKALKLRFMNFLARKYPEFHAYASEIVPHLPQIIEVSTSQPCVGALVLILMVLVVKPTWTRDPDTDDR